MKNNIKLVPFTDKYLPELYLIFSDQEQRKGILPHKHYVTEDQFDISFKRHIEQKYTEFRIILNEKDEFVGFLIAYDYYINDRHMKVTVYVKPEYQHSFYALMGGVKFVDYLFIYYSLNKIYTEVYSFNKASMSLHTSFGFKQEAKLTDYKYYDGAYYDLLFYSISREEFYETVKRANLL